MLYHVLMLRRTALIFLVLLAVPSFAEASTPRLTMRRARAALASTAVEDRAASYRIYDCHRLGRSRVKCYMSERGTMAVATIDGQPALASFWSNDEVVLRGRHVDIWLGG